MRSIHARFFSKVFKDNSCWMWLAAKNRGGYGLFRKDGSAWLAHRVSWEMANGPIPAGMDVLHSCDVPACVNPGHLFIGTAADNMADMSRKGRHRSRTKPESVARGQAHYKTKITPEIAAHIRKNAIGRGAQRALAHKFGLSEAAVSLVVRWKSWT